MPRPRGLVLGCTHFPVLKETIAKVAGSDVILIDSAETTAAAVEKILREKSLLNNGPADRRAFWRPMRPAASPIWARFSWASRSIRAA